MERLSISLCCDNKMSHLCDLLISSTSPPSQFQTMCIKVPVTSPCTLFLLLQTRDSNFVLQNVYVPLEKCTQRSAAWGILIIYSLLGFCSLSAFFMVQSFGSLLLLLKKKLCLHLSFLHLGDSGEEKRESQTLCHYLQAAGGTNHFLKIWH